MTDAERRALDDEAQLIALAKAEEAGTLPKEDRRHGEAIPSSEIPDGGHEVLSVTAEAPGGDLVTFVAESDAPVIPNDQIHVVLQREDGVRVDAGGSIIDGPPPRVVPQPTGKGFE